MANKTRPGFWEDWPRGFWGWLSIQQAKSLSKQRPYFDAGKVTVGCYLKCSDCKATIWVSGPLGERYFTPAVQQMVMRTHLQAHLGEEAE